MPDQPSLFEETLLPRPAHVHREDFLAGLLATWLLGDKKPNQAQRVELAKIARRAMRDAEMVVALHA